MWCGPTTAMQKPADGDWTNYTPVGTAAGKYADA
jgi:hypothetical protein